MRFLPALVLFTTASLAAHLYVRAIYLDENDQRKRITSGANIISDRNRDLISANIYAWSSGMYSASTSGNSITVYNNHPVESYGGAERVQQSIWRVINAHT